MKLPLLIIPILIMTASVAHAAEFYINGSSRYGCTDEAFFKKTGEMVIYIRRRVHNYALRFLT